MSCKVCYQSPCCEAQECTCCRECFHLSLCSSVCVKIKPRELDHTDSDVPVLIKGPVIEPKYVQMSLEDYL